MYCSQKIKQLLQVFCTLSLISCSFNRIHTNEMLPSICKYHKSQLKSWIAVVYIFPAKVALSVRYSLQEINLSKRETTIVIFKLWNIVLSPSNSHRKSQLIFHYHSLYFILQSHFQLGNNSNYFIFTSLY